MDESRDVWTPECCLLLLSLVWLLYVTSLYWIGLLPLSNKRIFFHMNRTGSGHRWSKVGCLSQTGTWPWNQFDCDREQRLASSSLVFLVSWFVRKWGIVMDYGDLAQNGNFKREKRMENYEFSRLLRSSLWNPHIFHANLRPNTRRMVAKCDCLRVNG